MLIRKGEYVYFCVSVQRGTYGYPCPVCEKTFSRKFNMAEHFKIHTGVRPFKCNLCEKAFTLKGNLKKHMIIHFHSKKKWRVYRHPCLFYRHLDKVKITNLENSVVLFSSDFVICLIYLYCLTFLIEWQKSTVLF